MNFGGTLGVTGATTLSSTLGVTGLATFNGGATIARGQNLNLPDFTPGSITFVNSSNQLAQDNAKLFYDQTNQGLGIGTNSVLASAGLTVSKNSLGNATVAVNQVGAGPIFTASSSGTTRFTIANNGDLAATGAISGLTGYSQSSGNFVQSGSGTFSTGTGGVTLNGNTSVSGSNTFTVGTGATTLGGTLGVTGNTSLSTLSTSGLATLNSASVTGNGTVGGTLGVTGATTLSSTLGVTGLATFNGGATIASGQTFTANGESTFSPNGSNGVVINTSGSNFLTLNGLTTPGTAGTPLCVDASNNVTECSGNTVTLQSAYNGGNSITTTTGSNIAFNLASGLATSTSFALTNAGTAPAFIINDTNAATNTSLEIQHAGSNTLTIDENGNLGTSGNISQTGATTFSTGTGGVTLNGNTSVSGSNTFTVGTGATTLGGTLGVTGNTSLLFQHLVLQHLIVHLLLVMELLVELWVTGATRSSTLGVTGLATFNGGATIASGQNLNLPDFTPGSITFVNSSNQLAQDNAKLFYDQTNQGLGIGTNSVLASAGLTVSKNSLGNATVAVNQVGAGPIFTASSSGTTRFTIANNGDLAATGAISGLTGYSQSSGNFVQSGSGTFSTGTGGVTLNGNTSVSGSNTFTVGTGATTLGGTLGVTGNTSLSTLSTSGLATLNSASVTGNGTVGGTLGVTGATTLSSTLGVTGLATFNGGATIASGQTFTANGESTFSPNGSNGVVINTSGSNFLTLNGLTTPGTAGTPLCVDASNNVTECSGNTVTLQSAYNGGNSITTTTGSNIAFNLASGLATSTSFALTNAGTAPAFIINDTNAATNTSLEIQHAGSNTLTIDENGNLGTSGNISQTGATTFSTGTGGVTLNGNTSVSGSNTFTVGTGATTLGGTLGVAGDFAINTNKFNVTASNGNTTVGGTFAVTGDTTLTGKSCSQWRQHHNKRNNW